MKPIFTFLLVFASLCGFSQNKVKLINSSGTGVFHNLVFEEPTMEGSLYYWGFPPSCFNYKRYYMSNSVNFNGFDYINIGLYWDPTTGKWLLFGSRYKNGNYNPPSNDYLGYFSDDVTTRIPTCGSTVIPEAGISFGGTLTIVNETGEGCLASSCTAPSSGPVLENTSVNACIYSPVSIPATCSNMVSMPIRRLYRRPIYKGWLLPEIYRKFHQFIFISRTI